MAYHMMILVPSYQKVPKVKIACSYSKEGDLYSSEDSWVGNVKIVPVDLAKYLFKMLSISD